MTQFKDRPDSRPVNIGDLVAAQWYPDETYYVGEVDVDICGYQIVNNIGGCGNVDQAYHVIKLMDAEQWSIVLDNMEQEMFKPLVEAFPMVTTGDYSPEDTLLLSEQVKLMAIKWLHWNYPRD